MKNLFGYKTKSPNLRLSAFALVLLFSALKSHATVYGENSLQEVSLSRHHLLSKPVATLIKTSTLFKPSKRTLKSAMVCEDELFVDQEIKGSCTGFLISPTQIMTAAHCVGGGFESFCKTHSWVFDHKLDSNDSLSAAIDPMNVYKCASITSSPNKVRADYAIVTLEKPVLDRKPVQIQMDRLVKKNDQVFTIHAPRGLPLKYSTGFVRESAHSGNYFVTNLDTMRGSSGAPVFDARTEKVVGMLVQGDHDFELLDERFCNAFKRCDDTDCRGESVLSLNSVMSFM